MAELNEALVQKPNWWQRRAPWQKASISAVFLGVMAVLLKPILFPPSNQQILEKRISENKRVAVLPLQNINDDPQIQLFSQGLAVTLSTELGKVGREKTNSWVIPSTEVAKLKNLTVSDAHTRYGADLVLTGSIQHLGSQRLINLELIDGASGVSLNQQQFKVNVKDLFASNQAVFDKAITMLNWPTSDMASKGTEFDGAYKHYITAIGYLFRSDQEKHIDNAIGHFESAIELDAQYIDAFIGLANAHLLNYQTNKIEESLSKLQQIVARISDISPSNAKLAHLNAALAIRQGKAEEAIAVLEAALLKSPKDEHLHFEMARAYQQLKKNEFAEQYYLSGLAITPNYWRGLSKLGRFYYRTGQFKKSANIYHRLAELTPLNYSPFIGLTVSYYHLGEMDKALEYSIKANNVKPSSAGYSNIGALQFHLGKYRESIDSYLASIKLLDNQYIIWGNLGDSYWVLNDSQLVSAYSKAAELAKEALNVNEQDSVARLHLAYYLARLNQSSESLELINTLTEDDNNLEFYLAALSYNAIENTTKALEMLEVAIEKGYSKEEILHSPLWQNIKENVRFKKLLEQK